MIDQLTILCKKTHVGDLFYDRSRDRISLQYDQNWSNYSESFPISLSLPMEARNHSDETIRAFITGLLPDNDSVLKSWAKRFHVSEGNPFDLLKNVGEDCAGALQFIQPDRLDVILSGELDEIIKLSEQDLIRHFEELDLTTRAIPTFDSDGRFSLAGAQSKTALLLKDNKWFLPKGNIPTTHILKPQQNDFEEHSLNEHTCLMLAAKSGLPCAKSSLIQVAGNAVISVKRYDRISLPDGSISRVHQEDCCQAYAISPYRKYQSEGGPSVPQICELLRVYSSRSQDDIENFIRALALNWAIVGTDAHSKNFSLLHAPGSRLRLAPLYDLASFLPYRDAKSRKVKMAMKYGHTYRLHEIDRHQWSTLATEAKLKPAKVLNVVEEFLQRLIETAIPETLALVGEKHSCDFLTQLGEQMSSHTVDCLETLNRG